MSKSYSTPVQTRNKPNPFSVSLLGIVFQDITNVSPHPPTNDTDDIKLTQNRF